ncbi:uncharacterized protein EDB91DRAFT_1113930 [Suillus paluster]|uniref:uncharacterized protein n=1 Tax=Suillus paluster TaxID=48578 RepID=UPI001B876BAD|nr:uncharacterized protein EDB91DRAFT_1113930 [Suillus paluster]KAG1748430.1 hypothetical protein EDB91DRAFT_1113930 [Suillus paluster]
MLMQLKAFWLTLSGLSSVWMRQCGRYKGIKNVWLLPRPLFEKVSMTRPGGPVWSSYCIPGYQMQEVSSVQVVESGIVVDRLLPSECCL